MRLLFVLNIFYFHFPIFKLFKICFNRFYCAGRRKMPAVDMVALIKLDKLSLYGGRVERLNYNKFDFHFVGDYRLYID